jgi:hypothetical protein
MPTAQARSHGAAVGASHKLRHLSSVSADIRRRIRNYLSPGKDPAAPGTLLDLRDVTTDPVHAAYLARSQSFLIAVPINLCRTLSVTAFRCGADGDDPLTRTLCAYAAGECPEYTGSPLHRFFEQWQPSTVAEVLGIQVHSAPPYFQSPPSGRPVLPWSHRGGESSREARYGRPGFKQAMSELNNPTDADGIIFYGPVGLGFGQITYQRLVRLFDSIQRHGYDPEGVGSHHIQAYALNDSGDCRYIILGGKHRIAALGAHAFETVPLQLGANTLAIVRRDDWASWPNVRNGLYSGEMALALFDRMFAAIPPGACLANGSAHPNPLRARSADAGYTS